MQAVCPASLEENMASRLARLEQKLEAYRKLHAGELEEIARELAELRREFEALPRVAAALPDRSASHGLARN